MLKIGNKVRRINDDYGHLKVGDIGIVSGVIGETLLLINDDCRYMSKNFELVKEDKDLKNIFTIIGEDNLIIAANNKLFRKYNFDQIILDFDMKDDIFLVSNSHCNFRRLNKVSEPIGNIFNLPQDWNKLFEFVKTIPKKKEKIIVYGHVVNKISNHNLKVGCKHFDRRSLEDLQDFMKIYGGSYKFEDKIYTSQDIENILSIFED